MINPKKRKKGLQITIDEKKGHLFVGDDIRILMLRPIDIIEFCEFAGANAADILIWVGKTIGKYFMENSYLKETDWTSANMHDKKNAIKEMLEDLEQLGYGSISLMCKKSEIFISVHDPISDEEKDNIMAKNLCLIYQGIFQGILDFLQLDSDGEEIKCFLLGDEADVYKFDLLIDEFDAEDIDEEAKSSEGITGFLSSL